MTSPRAILRSGTAGVLACLSLVVAACDSGSPGPAPATATSVPASATPTAAPTPTAHAPGPFERTEERAPCDNFNRLRTAYFGDLHVHTGLSADAYIFGTRVGPREAYAFARGAEITLSDDDEIQSRRARIDRPLDFAAVTDHAEFFGEVLVCTTPDSPVYDIEMCQELRQAEDPALRLPVTAHWLFPAGIPNPPPSHAFCNTPGVDCDAAAVSVWQEIQAAAEEAYDRAATCGFTTFVAYEHTASTAGRHLHRNVIFRNHHVPSFAASQLETAGGGVPQGLWSAIEADCLNAGEGCDAVLIPHNSNLSGGQQWLDPADATEAKRRQRLEPLAEVHQQKGNSECRFDRIAGIGVGTEDELCTFEQLLVPHELPGTQPPPIDRYPARNLVRNILKEGLRQEDLLGVNPFKLGLVGSTDTHNAAAGNADEQTWEGAQGNADSSPERQVADNLRDNPGGLAGVWAEENSRDAIFAALRRRETYATSGTRPVVRFFAGALADLDCGDADFVERAYRDGTPMGGDVGAVLGTASPRFAVLAFKDPGTATAPGTDLQRAQIVKGWVDAGGQTHEKVFDVAGDADNGAGVDPTTCEPTGAGAAQLCNVWVDPEFDASQRAFYYVRLLENPTCRWSTRVCKRAGVDPFAPDCAAQAAAVDPAFADCCLAADERFLGPVIQERAWTSPIWYSREAIAAVNGGVRFGSSAGADVLALEILVGALPPALDLRSTALTLSLRDDDVIYRVTLPAGAFEETSPTLLTLDPDTARTLGLASASLEIGPDRAGRLLLESAPLDLSHADRIDHIVELSLQAEGYEAAHSRLWTLRGDRLAVGS